MLQLQYWVGSGNRNLTRFTFFSPKLDGCNILIFICFFPRAHYTGFTLWVNYSVLALSTFSLFDGFTSQVESILDKENFTVEELLDEEEIIQECKALNSRLINLSVFFPFYLQFMLHFCCITYLITWVSNSGKQIRCNITDHAFCHSAGFWSTILSLITYLQLTG